MPSIHLSFEVQRFPSSGHGVKSSAGVGGEQTPLDSSHVPGISHTLAGQATARSRGQFAPEPSHDSGASHRFAAVLQGVPAGRRFDRHDPLEQVSGRSHAELDRSPQAEPFDTFDQRVVLV